MRTEVITRIFEIVGSTGDRDFIQEITKHVTAKGKQSEELSYRRVSDRADLKRLSEKEFQVVTTDEKIITK